MSMCLIYMKNLSLLWLLTLLGVCHTALVDDFAGLVRNSLLEQQVLALLETFRETMSTGSDGVPVLDPLHVEHIYVDENDIDLPGSRLTINELVIKYLSTFIVDDLSISLSNIILFHYSVQFAAHIPLILVEAGEYDLYLSAMNNEIFGRGDGKVEIIEPKVSGSFTFHVWSMSISNMKVDVSLSKFEPQLTGLFFHEGANNFANAFLANLVPEMLVFYEDEIRNFLSPLLQDLANQLLEDVSIGDLFPQLQHIKNLTPEITK